MSAVDTSWGRLARAEFCWLPEVGMGHFPIADNRVYDQSYFDKYVGYAGTEMGKKINEFRVALLSSVWLPKDRVLDVGIGCGSFVSAARGAGIECCGYDCNPAARRWLAEREWEGKLTEGFQVVTFWDSLEHMEDPWQALRSVGRVALVSLPVAADGESWLRSKHFRKDEHRWYWNKVGFERFASSCGFRVEGVSDQESKLGRDSILTFTLRLNVDHA